MDRSTAVTNGTSGAAQVSSRMANHQSDKRDASVAPSTTTTDSQNSRASSASNSVPPSPLGSRDSSPVRHPHRTSSTPRLSAASSRKSSQQDLSPTRQMRSNIPGPPSASRSLSSTATPSLLPATKESQIHSPTPQKTAVSQDPRDGPRWPVSPRLRSPPPSVHKPNIPPPRRNEQEPPAISIQRPSPSPLASDSSQIGLESEGEESQDAQSGARTPAPGGLETVQEVSLPNSPSPKGNAALMEQMKEKLPTAENHSDSALPDGRTLRARPKESGSDSSSAKIETRRTTSVPPPLVSRQSSAMSAKQMKTKPEGSTQNMTVETETVASVPQVALTTGSKSDGGNGMLKTKPSSETIKPKKDKKKPARKQVAVSSGNASSKADVFEAKIASAVDEADTSDSEETFVYDSNPPDGGDRTTRRFHSRTPSATSMASQADRSNLRSIYSVLEGGPAPAPKKSMKFVNTSHANGVDALAAGDDDGKGTGRSAGGSGRGTTRHHHHIGRWGRQPHNGHASLFDNESPFPNAARAKHGPANSRNSSGPPSPRNHHARGGLSTKRSNMQMSSSYDMDDTTGADDERTPLIGGSLRTGRSGRLRRGPHNLRQAESQTFTRRSSYLNRFAACLVLTMMLLLVITGAIGFMFATSQPMTNIEIVSISNVVTSEQVLMYDLTVKAHNPNIVVVTIDQANLEVFAKSEFAGAGSDWWDSPDGPGDANTLDVLANDPPIDGGDPDDNSKPNILLGQITEFDSSLTFEGSLFHQGTSSSTGEMQLENPGNGTSGGPQRWEKIYQNEFDLIVKGVVKYSLPLSARVRSATVSGRTHVKPNSANDPSLRPNSTIVDEPQ